MIAIPETKQELLDELYKAFDRIDILTRQNDELKEALNDATTQERATTHTRAENVLPVD